MEFNLNNKKFRSEYTSENSEVSDNTIFIYHQENTIIWATYGGGNILKGSLIGKIIDTQLEFVYQHINTKKELKTGKCTSFPELSINGKIRLNEIWQWTCNNNTTGKSTLIEI